MDILSIDWLLLFHLPPHHRWGYVNTQHTSIVCRSDLPKHTSIKPTHFDHFIDVNNYRRCRRFVGTHAKRHTHQSSSGHYQWPCIFICFQDLTQRCACLHCVHFTSHTSTQKKNRLIAFYSMYKFELDTCGHWWGLPAIITYRCILLRLTEISKMVCDYRKLFFKNLHLDL